MLRDDFGKEFCLVVGRAQSVEQMWEQLVVMAYKALISR